MVMGDGVVVQPDLADWLLVQVQADLDALDQMSEYDCDAGGHWMYGRIRVECDTKRRIIETHAHAHSGPLVACVACGDRDDEDDLVFNSQVRCQTLRLQTLPFVDRDGYRADLWAPDGR